MGMVDFFLNIGPSMKGMRKRPGLINGLMAPNIMAGNR